MDCLFNFCGLVVGLVQLGFSPTIKSVAEKPFDVKEPQYRFGEIKSQLVMYYLSLNENDSNELNFVYFIGVIMCQQHCMNSDTNIISHRAFLK